MLQGFINMGDIGLEQNPENISQPLNHKEVSENTPKHSIAQRVHNRVHKKKFPPELQKIISQWNSLPEHIKAAITALVKIKIR